MNYNFIKLSAEFKSLNTMINNLFSNRKKHIYNEVSNKTNPNKIYFIMQTHLRKFYSSKSTQKN